MSRNHSHYYKDVRHLSEIDVYRVLELFGVTDPCIQHAVKKLLVAGDRGVKDQERDIRESVDTLNRLLQMRAEDCNAGIMEPRHAPPETVQMELAVKVDPAAGLLVEALELIKMHADGTFSTNSMTAARELQKKIESTDFKPMALDRNEAAAAQGVDLVQQATEPVKPPFRHRMAQHPNSAMLPQRREDREVDSYSHIAAGIKGTAQ